MKKTTKFWLTAALVLLSGTIPIQAQSRELISPRFMVYLIEEGGKYGLETEDGITVEPQYKSIKAFHPNDNLFLAEQPDGTRGVITYKGVTAVPFQKMSYIVFENKRIRYITSFDDPQVFIQRADLVASGVIDEVVDVDLGGIWSVNVDKELWKRKMPGERWALYTHEGKKICEFADIEPYFGRFEWDGWKFFTVKENGKYGMMMYKEGKYDIPVEIKYDDLRTEGSRFEPEKYRFITGRIGGERTLMYMDGQLADGTVPHSKPKTQAEQKQLQAAAVTREVNVSKKGNRNTSIVSVTTAYDHMDIECTYYETRDHATLGMSGPGGRDAYYVKAGDQKYQLQYLVESLPNMTKRGKRYTYILRFHPLPEDVQQFDLIEGEDGDFNFYGVTFK